MVSTNVKKRGIAALIPLLVMTGVGVIMVGTAEADNVQNDVVAGGNDTMTAGSSTTINYRIGANNGDDQTGCNAADSSAAVVTIDAPAGVTANTTSLTFTSCGTEKPVVFSSTTAGDYEITVTVSDSGVGTYNVNPAKFTLHVLAASNTAPNITTLNGSSPYSESGSAARTFNFGFTDPNANTWSFVGGYPDCGTGGSLSGTPSINQADKTGTFDCIFDDGLATPTVSVKISDGTAESNVKTLGVTVTNVDPTSSLSNDGPVDEGSPVAATFGTVNDPSNADTTAAFKFDFECENDTASLATTFSAAAGSNTVNCTYGDNGPQTIAGRVFDKDDGYNTYATNVTVNNVAPSISSASFGATSTECSAAGADNVTLEVAFTDPGTLDTHTLDIDWDNDGIYDETVEPYTTGTEVGHVYATAGSHEAKVRVTDDDGAVSGTATVSIVVNYNLSSILQPINDTRNGQPTSLFKYGSTIPVKVEVRDCDGSHPASLVLKVTWRQGLNGTPVGTDEVVPTSQADLGNQMRFSDPLYVLQLNSKSTTSDSTSGITVFVTIPATGQTVSANLGFKK